jgi:hypothetical protein
MLGLAWKSRSFEKYFTHFLPLGLRNKKIVKASETLTLHNRKITSLDFISDGGQWKAGKGKETFFLLVSVHERTNRGDTLNCPIALCIP